MNRFWESLIEPALEIRRPRVLVEIGAETGKATEKLLNFCVKHDAVLHSIDPQPKFDVAAWQSEFGPRFIFHESRSLDALVKIGPCDAVLIDGDHNWYTVYHELRLIDENARGHHRPFPLVFLHDVGWPYGRRDLYYNPDDIPEEHRQPFLRQGMRPGESDLLAMGGLNSHLFNATREGGARNGVLTAIEDFLGEKAGTLEFLQIPALQGLGIVYPVVSAFENNPLRDHFVRLSTDATQSSLIEVIERDRVGLQMKSAELAQRAESERLRNNEQTRLLTAAQQKSQDVELRFRELEKQSQANERSRRATEKQWQATLTTLRTATEQTRQAVDELREQREFFQAELISERELLKSELATERERLQSEAEKRAKAQEEEENAQLSKLQTAVESVLLREQAYVESARHTEERLGRIDEHLAWLAARASTRKSAERLRLARREILEARQDLAAGTDRSVFGQAGDRRGGPIAEVLHRFLPGRPKSGAPDHESATARTANDAGPISSVDIVVCVHNAIDDVRRCLAALVQHTDSRNKVFVVDDGSDAECAAYLQDFTRRRAHFTLLRNDEPLGYTRAANRGLRTSTADMVVLLNSDTIVTDKWLERLLECARSDPAIGIVGPLSNAASYQSVPERADANGDWSLNPAPPGWDIEQLAAAVAEVSDRTFPRVPFVNGFCFAVKRGVIESIGPFDEDAFPEGYGEENDYALRAADAGFTLAIADHAYVHHAKSRSYSHERRRELGKDGRGALLRKHGRERVIPAESILRDDPTLARMRQALAERLKDDPPPASPLSVLFLLPVSGGGGGAHSIVQEAAGMRGLGIKAQVAVKARHLQHYRNNYPAVCEAEEMFFGFDTEDELLAHAARFSVVVATIHTSVPLLATIAEDSQWVVPAYYVQDYEPYFYAEGSPEREDAARSYTLIPGAVLFAKTEWLCDTVSGLHGVDVHKVSPSLDHDVYYPSPDPRDRERVRVAAMIRPRSRRRGAPRTMEVLKRLTEEFGKQIDVQIFGCMKSDIAAGDLPNDFRYKNHGILKREQVAEVLRQAEVFLDLSDYQAFGRTGLEAMACGCAVVVPALGGTSEYAENRHNSLVVDTSNLHECYKAASQLVKDGTLRESIRRTGLQKATDYTIERAASSEFRLFAEAVSAKHSEPAGSIGKGQQTIRVAM